MSNQPQLSAQQRQLLLNMMQQGINPQNVPFYGLNPQSFMAMNKAPSPSTHGLFSTYPARLKQSTDNALLLPSSYLTTKKNRFISESDDEFDDMEESDDENASGMRTRSATAAGTTSAQGPAVSVPSLPADLPKVVRKKEPKPSIPQENLEQAAELEEVLVPVRLDIDVDDIKLRDVFLWNMNEQFLTPEKFAETLCKDLRLPFDKFLEPIAESIRLQVLDYESIHEIDMPPENVRVLIKLDLQVGKVNLRDQFEWDLDNIIPNAPEIFSKQLAAELGLGGEYVPIISHAIREQLYTHRKQMIDEYALETEVIEPLSSAFRRIEDAPAWTPQMDVLSNEELEQLLIAQGRNIRRLRRETRFKRSRRRGSVTPSRRFGSNAGTPS